MPRQNHIKPAKRMFVGLLLVHFHRAWCLEEKIICFWESFLILMVIRENEDLKPSDGNRIKEREMNVGKVFYLLLQLWMMCLFIYLFIKAFVSFAHQV